MDYAPALKLFLLLFTLTVNTALAIIVYKNNPKSVTNLILSFLSIVTSIWLLDMYLSLHPAFYSYTLILDRLSIFLAVPQVVSFFLLSLTLPFDRLQLKKRSLAILFTLSALIMVITISPFAFTKIEFENGSPNPVAGPGMLPFATFTICLSISSIYFLIKRHKNSDGTIKQQLGFVMFGILLMLGLIITTILLPVVIFKNTTFVSFSPLYTLVFLGMTTYAIIRHKFLDIRLMVARAIAYTGVIIIFGTLYALGLFLIGQIVTGKMATPQELITSAIFAILIALSFQPLRRSMESMTDKIFYKGHYDPQEFMKEISYAMATTLELEMLTFRVLDRVTQNLKITRGAFVLLSRKDENVIDYIEQAGYKEKPVIEIKEIEPLLSTRNTIIFDDLEEGPVKESMRKLNISAALPLFVRDTKIGVLILGEKKSGDSYSEHDIDVLEILAPQLSIAIQNSEEFEEIKRFNITLKEEVDKATKDLQDANAKLMQLDHLKDEFVSIASHELRTPMTVIKSYIWVLLNDKKMKFDEKQKMYLERTYDSTERLIRLVNDMLNVSRIESGRIIIEPKETDIVKLSEDVIAEIQPRAQELKIKLGLDKDGDVSKVNVDPDKTREILVNLIGNSLKFTPAKGKITVNLSQKDGMVLTRVSDTGVGITKEDMPKLFQKFGIVGANYLQKNITQGTGLGLYISKAIVELQGGKMWAESEGRDKGTSFFFTLKPTS